MRSMRTAELQGSELVEAENSPSRRRLSIGRVPIALPSLHVNGVLEQTQKVAHLVESRLEAGGASVVHLVQNAHGLVQNAHGLLQDYSPEMSLQGYTGMDRSLMHTNESLDLRGRRHQKIPSLGGKELLIDDEDATVVFVLRILPEGSGEEDGRFHMGPSSSGSEEEAQQAHHDPDWVDDPLERAREFFRSESAEGYLERELGQDAEEGVSRTEYIRAVRRVLALVISHEAGLAMTSFVSFDEDMVFWKVTATKDFMETLADMFQYKMPISDTAYASVKLMPPGKEDAQVYAYAPYTKDLREDFRDFNSVDEVRLVVQQLNRFISLHALQEQKIIEMWFPAAKFKSMQKLHKDVVTNNMAWLFMAAKKGMRRADIVREYFGEEVAFFFSFYEHYKYHVAMLCIPALFVTLVTYWPGSWPERIHKNMLKSVFGIVVAIWALVVRLFFHHRACKDAQRWGMDVMRRVEVDLPSYDPKLVGTWYLARWSAIGHLVTWLFLVTFVVAVCACSFNINDTRLRHRLQTGLTFVFGYMWSFIARWIADKENFRTQSRFNTALTKRLAYVKLFLYLFPLMKLAFMTGLTERICGVDQQAALEKFRQHEGFDPSLSAFLPINNASDEREEMFKEWATNQTIEGQGADHLVLKTLERVGLAKYDDKQVCLRGCMPMTCEWVDTADRKMVVCDDSCGSELQWSLICLFVTHSALTLLFIFIPMMAVKRQASKELRHVAKHGNRHRASEYSLLQFQEKCYSGARYDYLEWGGSYVEDFLELVLNFAVIATFGIVCPPIVLIALPLQVLEYRLLAYRMTWVTCRPFPNAADGIGKWDNVLEVISYCAVTINALLVVSTMRTKLDTYELKDKLLFVCGWTLVLQTLKMIIQVVLHDQPRQCAQNADEHHDLHEALRRRNWSATAKVTKVTKEASEVNDVPCPVLLGIGKA